jgi:hypothetical protein
VNHPFTKQRKRNLRRAEIIAAGVKRDDVGDDVVLERANLPVRLTRRADGEVRAPREEDGYAAMARLL